MPRTVLHVDMDAFYASIEVRDDPRLAGQPVLVGGTGRRGVVAAASYEARVFGCRSAQPTSVALRLCPHAVVLPPRFEVYAEASRRVFEILGRFTPLVEQLSIDEAFLDLSGSERLLGTPREVAERIRREVREATGLTCSVGIASVKFLAKIASAHRKPDAITEIPPGDEIAFLDPLPVRRLWGVGPRTGERLERLGIETVGDLRRHPVRELERRFGDHGRHLSELAHGRDERAVVADHQRKQISHEDTYAEDLRDPAELRRHLLDQATRVADRLAARGLRARRVHLKIRDGDFVTETRQRALSVPTRDARALYAAACELLEGVETEGRGFRLTGVGASDLEHPDDVRQLELFEAAATPAAEGLPAPDDRLQDVVSSIRKRYGSQALYRGDPPERRSAEESGAATSEELEGS